MIRLLVLASILYPVFADAGVINVDFQPDSVIDYVGAGVLGGAGDTLWNRVSGATATNLSYADGSGTSGVSLQVGGSIGSFRNDTQENDILRDWIYGSGGSAASLTITLSGLATNTSYDLAFYNGFYWQDYSVPSQPSLLAQTRPDYVNDDSDIIPFPTGTSATLIGVVSDANGQIVILDTAASGGTAGPNSAIAGLQIQQSVSVPEPSTAIAMGLLGVVGFAGNRRRRRQVSAA